MQLKDLSLSDLYFIKDAIAGEWEKEKKDNEEYKNANMNVGTVEYEKMKKDTDDKYKPKYDSVTLEIDTRIASIEFK